MKTILHINKFKILLVSIFMLILSGSSAQPLSQYVGDAYYIPPVGQENGVYNLTDEAAYSYGAVYVQNKISLSNAFTYSFMIYFGNNDNGADGMVFTLHNDSRGYLATGDLGMGLGYAKSPLSVDFQNGVSQKISPSIAIEFDTYQNSQKNDPSEDHIAYVPNGENNHSLLPASYLKKMGNIEDGAWHHFTFSWTPADSSLKVLFDYNQVLKINNNIKRIVGDSAWCGFSATTGGRFNKQQVSSIHSPLPIELLDFSALRELVGVSLKWTTITETNNDYFTLESSTNGTDFTSISILQGAGNSNSLLRYSHFDFSASDGTCYYRLKQTDFDGTVSYGPIVAVEGKSETDKNGIVSLIPENGNLNLTYRHHQDENISVHVLTPSGEFLNTETSAASPGLNQLKINFTGKSAGVYILVLASSTGTYQQKFFFR